MAKWIIWRGREMDGKVDNLAKKRRWMAKWIIWLIRQMDGKVDNLAKKEDGWQSG
jgi:hypothetical protein